MKRIILSAAAVATAISAAAQHTVTAAAADSTDTGTEQHLGAATVQGTSRSRRTGGAMNTMRVGQDEMFRAACCNLGESFVTNPSVDVSYDDAATGASQIKLLGLSGLYVQMLTETLPAFRGAAQPFALGYVPGTWMKSINVSKGAASVKNGYESITGQIDIDYLKPDDERATHVNLYANSRAGVEGNADANFHINPRLFGNVLLHYQDQYAHHDANHDGFRDMPRVRQYNAMTRWKYRGDRYIMHAGLQALSEQRRSGQTEHPAAAFPAAAFPAVNGGHSAPAAVEASPRFAIDIPSQRIEAYMKHAFILDSAHGTNIAFMANASWQGLDADYGCASASVKGAAPGASAPFPLVFKSYSVEQTNVNAQLMYETNFTDRHALSAGLSLLYDNYDERLSVYSAAAPVAPAFIPDGRELVPGAYAQYTYTLGRKFTLMAGLRYDYNDRYDGGFLTPRMHLKWSPSDYFTLRASSGLGYRSPHVMAENHNLLASGRTLVVLPDAGNPAAGVTPDERLDQEKAWNSGISAAFSIPFGERLLRLNAEYYYTNFMQQVVVDYEHTPGQIAIHNLRDSDAHYSSLGSVLPKSYSHVVQVDAQMELFSGFDVTMAYRHNVVRCTYGDVSAAAFSASAPAAYRLRERLLTPRFKALLSLSYQTPLKLWQFDATLSLNGSGRLPDGTVAAMTAAAQGSGSAAGAAAALTTGPASVYSTAEGDFFRPVEQLSAQVTRRFRHVDIYVGGENLTNRRQPVPIVDAATPFASTFEPTLVYAPTDGWMLYGGLRLKF